MKTLASATHRSGPRAPARWSADAAGWTLGLVGDWRGHVAGAAESAPRALLAAADAPDAGRLRLVIDGSGLVACDDDLAPALWRLLAPLARRGAVFEWRALPEAARASLEFALEAVKAEPVPAVGATVARVPQRAGVSSAPGRGWRSTLVFFGEATLALVRLARGRGSLRATGLVGLLDQAGPRCLPIVALTTSLVGLMLAYMGGAQLGRIGAQSYIADVVTVGMVREVAALMTGVILAGRVGAAFAAQLGTMQASEEIDALRTLGVDPMEHLVLPRLLAMLVMAPPLLALAMLIGVLAGAPAAVWVYDVPMLEYLHQSLRSLTWTHLWIGLFKGSMYSALVALAGCQEGLLAGRDAQAVGEATTRAVVKAIVWIVAAACISTVLLQRLGF
jgi:phospholipid/cholesterol/gamma-HCH transport system permease protein